jgi:hypothetical protein
LRSKRERCGEISKDEIEAFCRKRRVEEFSIFGAALRDDFGPASVPYNPAAGQQRIPIELPNYVGFGQTV